MHGHGAPPMNSIKAMAKDAVQNSVAVKFETCLQPVHRISDLAINSMLEDMHYIDGVLTASECAELCNACGNCDEMRFWSPAGRDDDTVRSFRDADTVEVKSHSISSKIWERMRHLLPRPKITVVDDQDDVNWEKELVGDWEASSLNFDLLFAKYPSGGAFSPHTDGRAIHDFNTRSFYSVIIFLNDIESSCGGGTRFYQEEAIRNLKLVSDVEGNGIENHWSADESFLTNAVSAVSGRMLFFHQSLVHEGVPPLFPHTKFIIRSDIMYRRCPGICTQPHDLEAYTIFREAEDLAEKGHVAESIKLFKRCFKLSPDMARVMGQG